MKKKIIISELPRAAVYNICALLVLLTVMSCSSGFSQSWIQLKDIGTTVTGSSAASPPLRESLSLSVNGKIYVIGSATFNGNTPTAMIWEYDPANDSWTEKSAYPGQGRSCFCGFTIGDWIYVGCGTGFSTYATSDFYKYNTVTNSWTAIADIPVARVWATGFAIGSKGYITGGESNVIAKYLGDLWEYDTASNHWTQKANFPDTSRVLSSSFSAGGFGFVGLGYSLNIWHNDFYKYDPGTNSWTAISSLPGEGRCGAACVVRGAHGVIICGNKSMNVFNECYSYNTVLDTWSNFYSFSGDGRSRAVCGLAGDQLYAGGGGGVGGATNFTDWWSIPLTVGVSNYFLEKGQVYIYHNALSETILRSNTEVAIGNPYRVFDALGRQVSSGIIAGSETKLQVEIPGIYTIVIGSDCEITMKYVSD